MDLRLTRKIRVSECCRLELTAESFNLFNRDNRRYSLSDDGFMNSAGQFVGFDRKAGGRVYPAYYQQPTNFMKATSAYAPRLVQLGLRFVF